ncbi:hypothetical protein J3D46_004829 [Paenarthrobacter sp. A20]|nr:hypothetical protein [Paenarthrobacter sp. A20]
MRQNVMFRDASDLLSNFEAKEIKGDRRAEMECLSTQNVPIAAYALDESTLDWCLLIARCA